MRPSTKRSGKGKPGGAAARVRRRQGGPGRRQGGRAQPRPGPLTPSRGHTPVRPGAGGWGVSRSRSGPWRAPVSAPPPSRLAGVGSGGRTHRARVSARPTAALVQRSLGLAPLQPAWPQAAGGSPRPVPALTFRHDLLGRRGWGLQRTQRGYTEAHWEGLCGGAQHATTVVIPWPKAFPPGGCSTEHLLFPLHQGTYWSCHPNLPN